MEQAPQVQSKITIPVGSSMIDSRGEAPQPKNLQKDLRATKTFTMPCIS
jgi:hypothetical protein